MQLKDRYGRSAKMEQFLRKHNMHPEFTNMKEVLTKFRHHMNLGLAAQPGSLLMIPTYVKVPKQLLRNRKVVAMDAGGTNLRSATVWFMDNGDPMLEDFTKAPMPASDGRQLSKHAFYQQLARSIASKTKEHAHIGICFSYPTQSTPECDGKVLFFSKEIDAPEVVGSYVGHSLKEAIKELEPASQIARILVVNDTVTTLLSGLLHSDSKHFSSYIGFILGTGMNIAYVAPNSAITKLHDLDPRSQQVVNLEAGGFNALHRGSFDRMLDQETASPGTFFMEKMMSGAYFGRLVAITLEQACEEGLFEEDSANRLRPILHELDTATVCDFYNNIHHDDNLLSLIFSEVALSQKELAGQLIANLVQRMAKIIAATLSATILHSGEGFLPQAPVCITVDGTTYFAFNGLADEVKRLMREEILIGAYKRYFTTVTVENASLVGAAIATYAF